MKHGGKRIGAGGVKDATRPNFNAYWKPEEIRDYMDWVKENYKKDTRLATWAGDHLFGKAVQPIGNDGDKPFQIAGVEITVRK